MASTGINFDKLTPPDYAVSSVQEVLFKEMLSPEALGRFATIMRRQVNGKKLAIVGEFGAVGVAGGGCDPEYGNALTDTEEKVWEIARYVIAEGICFEDLEGTLVQEALRLGTDVSNLDGTAYMTQIVLPLLKTAIEKAAFRIAWFGDKEATLGTSGGVLQTGVDTGLFTVTDGFWKRIFEEVAVNAARRVSIDANAQTTFATQQSSIAGAGVATGIMDSLIVNAPIRLRQAANQQILVTMKFKDALDADIKKNNVGSNLQWESIFNGIQKTNYNGIEMYAVPLWDEMIQGFEGQFSGGEMVAWNNPYRVLYTTKDNLLIGTTGDNAIARLDVHFDKKDRRNYIYATDTIGTLIKDTDLFQVAY